MPFVPDNTQQSPKGRFVPDEPLQPSFLDRLKGAAGTIGKTFLAVNPALGMRGATESQSAIDQTVKHAGYEAGGAVTDVLAPHTSPEMAAHAGYLANIYAQSVPVILGTWLGSGAGEKVGKEVGRDLMWSAVKPTIADQRTGKAARAVETLLKEGKNPTKGGVESLRETAEALTPGIDSAVASSTARVSPGAVADRLRQTEATFANQVNPNSDLRAVQDAWTEFLQHPKISGRGDIPVQLAHELKKGTYARVGGRAYGEVGTAATEAQKALARGLKEEVAAAVPAVKEPLARQSELYNAVNVAERRALMDLNKNPMGMALLAPNKSQLVAALLDKWALAKALAARAAYSGGGAAGTAIGGTIGGVLGARSAKLEE